MTSYEKKLYLIENSGEDRTTAIETFTDCELSKLIQLFRRLNGTGIPFTPELRIYEISPEELKECEITTDDPWDDEYIEHVSRFRFGNNMYTWIDYKSECKRRENLAEVYE